MEAIAMNEKVFPVIDPVATGKNEYSGGGVPPVR